MNKIAILYQADCPPAVNGIKKPMKPGGYSDSGADIAHALSNHGLSVVPYVQEPRIENDLDWVFPDTKEGIQLALNKGARTIWLNTVLYTGHPIEQFFDEDIEFVGQFPKTVDAFDDKLMTNRLLKENGLPIPDSEVIDRNSLLNDLEMAYPFIIKPIRGRGSQGVSLVKTQAELKSKLDELLDLTIYGTSFYIEKYLIGQEITITVMPPGNYQFGNKPEFKGHYWGLPAVKRTNHIDGVVPYNGTVAVINNSIVLGENELNDKSIYDINMQCEKAATLVRAKAPIRIDCRKDESGEYYIFDLNMKPNMTGPSRLNRQDQDNLSSLAAQKVGWEYKDLVINMVNQKWKTSKPQTI